LLVPDALPVDLCRELISVWESEGNEDSGFMVERDGKTVGEYNHAHKIRRDHFLAQGERNNRLQAALVKTVIPKIREAFAFDVTRKEDFRIACYDAARGGYFRPHRDNTTPGTAHRRLAMSLFLNDDYEGGYVRFPEYGPNCYRMPVGGAVVFSCSLLHEATDVTAGRRFVLLTFFYGEREAQRREEYNRRVGGEYRAMPAAPASASKSNQPLTTSQAG
jgi:predicted 2-oxoglutarate/Fe(II)-dependent dioxygenase YbiX